MAAGYEISAAIDPTGGKAGAPFNSPTIIDFGNGLIDAPSTLSDSTTDEPVATAATAGSRADSQGATGSTNAGGGAATSALGSNAEYYWIAAGVGLIAAVITIGVFIYHHKK